MQNTDPRLDYGGYILINKYFRTSPEYRPKAGLWGVYSKNNYFRTSAEYRPKAGVESHARGDAPSISHHCTGRP